MTVNDLPIASPFVLYDPYIGHTIFSMLDRSQPGDIPPDIAILPVIGIRSAGDVIYIDVRS